MRNAPGSGNKGIGWNNYLVAFANVKGQHG